MKYQLPKTLSIISVLIVLTVFSPAFATIDVPASIDSITVNLESIDVVCTDPVVSGGTLITGNVFDIDDDIGFGSIDVTTSGLICDGLTTNNIDTSILTDSTLYNVQLTVSTDDSSDSIDTDSFTQPSNDAPIITLLGDAAVSIIQSSGYVDAGATAFDTEDGDLTASIVTVNPVDTNVIGVYIVTYDVTDSDGNDAPQVIRTVTVHQKQGGGCRGDCTYPKISSFGVDSNFITPTGFYTPYPLITANTGENKTFTVKGCDGMGISHISLALGLTPDQYIADAQTILTNSIAFNGVVTTNEFDPNNNVKVLNTAVSKSQSCVTATFTVEFLSPLKEGKIGVDVWDTTRNSAHGYFNHGIIVTGDSLNPPGWVFVAPQKKSSSDDFVSSVPQVMFRNSDYFLDYKLAQQQAALEKAKALFGNGIFESFEYKYKSGMYDYKERMTDKLHEKMIQEQIKAYNLMKNKGSHK